MMCMCACAAPQFDVHAANMENVFIGISGLIGAGKTTLATALASRLGLPVYYEPTHDNIYLEDFYKDTKKHSFAMQVGGDVACVRARARGRADARVLVY